jgi:hypothetical protein
VAGAALVPALALPAGAAVGYDRRPSANCCLISKAVSPYTATEPDPIFAVIEAHKLTFQKWDAAVHFRCGLEESSKFTDPRVPAAQEVVDDLGDIKKDLLIDLVSTMPTTIAGVIALAEYYQALDLLNNGTEVPDYDIENSNEDELSAGAWVHFVFE